MATSIERGFMPLSKVEQEQPEENIHINLNLPDYVDQDRIGVNLGRIRGLCNLGGIRPLIIEGRTGEETSRVVPEIVGFNSDGSAIAAKKIEKISVPTFESNFQVTGGDGRQIATRWVGLRVNMNIDEIGLRASEGKEGVRSLKGWTKELDKGIKEPLRKAGNQNLLHQLESSDWFMLRAYGLLLTALPPISYMISGDPDFLGSIWVVGYSRGLFLLMRKGINGSDYKYSIFPGPQLDRAAILAIKSRTAPLIKDLHPDKK